MNACTARIQVASSTVLQCRRYNRYQPEGHSHLCTLCSYELQVVYLNLLDV